MKRILLFAFLPAVLIAGWSLRSKPAKTDEVVLAPSVESPSLVEGAAPLLTIEDLLSRARHSVDQMRGSLIDYSADFVKRERDLDGVLGEESQLSLNVQTGLANPDGPAAKRVYLKFVAPQANAGRQVIWGEDLYDGKMAVHEVSFLLRLKTIWLDPNGLIAMQGQRYPISEIGLVRLAEKLIERGEAMLSESGLSVTEIPDFEFDGHSTTKYRIERSEPSGTEDDFSVAEVVIDFDRHLVLAYESYDWPDQDSSERPLLESYQYRNVQTNVGLTDETFDVKNPEYGFPAF